MNLKTKKYWDSYAKAHHILHITPEAWMFGDGTKEMGDELGQLVVEGIKTGTCSAYELYEIENEVVPTKGLYEIVLNGDHEPLAIIQTTNVDIKKMNEVSVAFAKSEGEGDLSYDYWYDAHREFFSKLLPQFNLTYREDMLLVCQTFEVLDVYKKEN